MFSAKFRALQREAALASELLGVGVTALRKANHAQTGRYNNAFFNLSIGFERAAKLVFVVDYCVENGGRFPADADLRKIGHDIGELFSITEEIRNRRGISDRHGIFPLSKIHDGIVESLSEFAKASRYYNLDYLAGAKASALGDPIALWFRRVAVPILDDHYDVVRRRKDEGRAQALAALLNPISSIRHTDEEGNEIGDFESFSLHGAKTEVVQKWSQFYTLQLIRYVSGVISGLESIAHRAKLDEIPYLHEFFVIFRNEDSYFKSRKTWSPYT